MARPLASLATESGLRAPAALTVDAAPLRQQATLVGALVARPPSGNFGDSGEEGLFRITEDAHARIAESGELRLVEESA